jgi:hypothetical protein
MQTMPKLRGSTTLRIEEIVIWHVFGSEKFVPGIVRAFNNLPNPFDQNNLSNPFDQQALVHDMCVNNPKAPLILRSVDHIQFSHVVLQFFLGSLPKKNFPLIESIPFGPFVGASKRPLCTISS